MVPSVSLDSGWWHLVEYLYRMPDPPPRRRTKPMEVICVGPPRSGTESLQQALLTLGYDHTYHGWDIIYDEDCYSPGWVRLARKKWFGSPDGESSITAAEFDALLGHSVAVTDAASSVFAAEMIAAYPDAKVILNTRGDLDAWHQSAVNTLVHVNESWVFWLASFFGRECFWAWHVYERLLWPLLFRAPDGDLANTIRKNGKWIYREHCDMVRGLVPRAKLLEWKVGDGWEPLCKFLDKPIPSTPFPHVNAVVGGWKAREEQCVKRWIGKAFLRMSLLFLLALVATIYALSR
ncbi:NAD dependent epimerase/dehydratase [Pleurostoma richardsiae]|uniref:NAD dependent epimerase/dehydratase n=1 Tax=Pleurostoma richardsiae TaxID=41990 RepID=A0AA38RJR1_9PEZI|nr:NAD dependent epimerase/dehydratase [Pleurostoma richardsiae]